VITKILSEVTEVELTKLKLERTFKPIEIHYGMILRGERIAKKIYLEQLQELLKQQGIDKSCCTITRWERDFTSPSIHTIEIWASCLGLKMSVFVDAPDRRLVKGDWVEKLKALRKDRDIAREKINKGIGVHPWTITQWERGDKSPNESELKAWAQSLGATAYLVFERV
jgi:transcriptional regulator with XRE-family HTH domain